MAHVWIDSSEISDTIRGFYPMRAPDTGLAKARRVFTKHGGMCSAQAKRFGSAFTRARCMLSGSLAKSNGSVAAFTGSPPHRRSPARILFQSRFEFRARSSA
jgi:hypothetical protein